MHQLSFDRGSAALSDLDWWDKYRARAGNPHDSYGVECDDQGVCTEYWESLDDIAWYAANSDSTPHPVGQKRPNDFGLYDVLGNVSEWCHESEEVFADEPATDPYVPLNGQDCSMRGGGFWTEMGHIEVYRRSCVSCMNPVFSVGFRPVRTNPSQ